MDAFSDPAALRVSLEPLYLGDHRALVHDVRDNEPVFEQKKPTATKLREAIARIHAERGNIIDLTSENVEDPEPDLSSDAGDDEAENEPPHIKSGAPMPFSDVVKMRDDVSYNLYTASVELAQLQEVTNLLLASNTPPPSATSGPTPEAPPILLSASPMAPSEPKASVKATNIRVTLGVKDALLEDASSILSRASSNITSLVSGGQSRWEQAIRARRAHWTLLPQQPPPNLSLSPFLRREDTSIPKNFLISYALEESLPQFKRHSLVSLSDRATGSGDSLVFPAHPRRRLRVSLTKHLDNGNELLASNLLDIAQLDGDSGPISLQNRLLHAQRELLEEEIFSLLVQEASTFPSAAASVSERRITMMAAKDTTLAMELVSAGADSTSQSTTIGNPEHGAEDRILCTLILHILTLLLLRTHRTRRLFAQEKSGFTRNRHVRIDDLAYTGPTQRPSPQSQLPSTPILAPIVSLLQYRTFCSSIHGDLDKLRIELEGAGIPAQLMFSPVGESPAEAIEMLEKVESPATASWGNMYDAPGAPNGAGGKDDVGLQFSGEALLWVDDRHALSMTFASPTSLILHLPHATMPITSLTVLRTLLTSEVRLFILQRLQDEGSRRFSSARWALDRLDPACIVTWDDGRVTLRLTVDFDGQLGMACIASSEIIHGSGTTTRRVERYCEGKPYAEVKGEESSQGKEAQVKITLTSWFIATAEGFDNERKKNLIT